MLNLLKLDVWCMLVTDPLKWHRTRVSLGSVCTWFWNVVFSSPRDQSSEQLILDTTKFEAGKVFQVDWYSISPDGKLAGLALSTGGSEDASLYVIDTATGHQVGHAVPRANFATGGGAMAWTSDNSGFW